MIRNALRFLISALPFTFIVVTLLLMFAVMDRADAADFSVEFKPMKHDVLAAEVIWQAENVVDLQQTLHIARDPAHCMEVGTMSVFTGAHPSVSQVWLWSIVAGVGHYAVAQALTNAGMTKSARAWEYVNLGYKTWNIDRNYRNGLGL